MYVMFCYAYMFMFVLYIKYGCALRALEAERHIVMHLMFVWVCYQIIVAAAGPWSKVGGQRRHYLFWGTRACVVALRWRIQCFCLDGWYGRICCIMMQQSLSLRYLKSCVDTRNLERTKQLLHRSSPSWLAVLVAALVNEYGRLRYWEWI